MDALANFAYSTVATAPSPATSGTSLVVQAGDGAKFPTAPFDVVLYAVGTQPLIGNAEIARCTAVSTDTLTLTRAQYGTTAQSVAVGWAVDNAVTANLLSQLLPLSGGTMTGALTLAADPSSALQAATKEYADATIPYDALVRSLNPSAWWKLADAVGSLTALDSSGNGYNGTVSGGVTFGQPGAISGTPSDTAALFDGSTGDILDSSLLMSGASASMTVFFKTAGNAAAQFIATAGAGASASTGGLVFTMNANGTIAFAAGINLPTVFTTPLAYNDGHWHMAAITCNSAGLTECYIDGVLLGSGTVPPITSMTGFNLGSWLGVYYAGEISQSAVFPTALTAAQILALYNAAPKYGEQENNYVTTPTVTSGAAFTPSTTSNSMVTFQVNATVAGSYTLTMGPSTGAEITVGNGVAMVAGSDDVVTLLVPRGYRVVLTLTSVTLSRTTVITNPA